jgi:predicted porin
MSAMARTLLFIGAGFHVNANNGGSHANLFMFGTNYILSKRTLLYVAVGNVRNGANADFSVETSNNRLLGQSQAGAYLGITHTF